MLYEALTGRRPFAHDEADDFVAVSSAITRDIPTDPRELTEPGVIDDGVAEVRVSSPPPPSPHCAGMSTRRGQILV